MFVSHERQQEVECFLFWRGSAPVLRTEKALIDDCGLTLQTRWSENATKMEIFHFQWLSVVQKRLCLSSLVCLGKKNESPLS